MKPQIGIAIIIVIFVGVFFAYSNVPEGPATEEPATGETSLANVSESIENGIPEDKPTEVVPTEKSMPSLDIDPTVGLDEELQGIIEGFDIITEELQLLEGTSTEPQ